MTPDSFPGPEDAHLVQLTESALTETIRLAHGKSKEDEVAQAVLYFLVRVANSWRSTCTLWRVLVSRHPETFMVDVGTLVRAVYEAYLQSAYILHEQSRQHERARLYLEYEHVEKRVVLDKLFRHGTVISEALRGSPLRPDGEARMEAEYNRVKDRYLNQRRRGVRDKWYEGTLRNLAEAVGEEAEYDFFVSAFHGYVHSSAFAIRTGPPLQPRDVMTLMSILACKVANLAVKHLALPLQSEHLTVIAAYCGTPFLTRAEHPDV